MTNKVQLVAFPAKDLAKAKKFFNVFLGTKPYIDEEYYVGYKLDDGREIGLDPNGKAVISYVDVDDIKTGLQDLVDAGGKVVMDATEVGGGLQIAQVEIEGSVVGLRQQPKK